MPQQPLTEFDAYFALLEVGSLVQHGVEQQLRTAGGLSFVQFQILAILGESEDGTQTMTTVADRLVHSRSGLTYQAQKLESSGLITRTPCPDDDRTTILTLSPAGAALLARVLPGHMDVVRDLLLAPLDENDRTELTRILDKVRRHMRSRPPRSARRRRS
ncbi:MarR family transcriptional regulator [Nocardia sp. CDC159]|uniref:MarR family transcriptional regulator n=1 Tax=Nocardia pulmonis TaxID=2951408 RepID=A0A9X2E4U4_9NOCA|nr:MULTISPECIES: MarR family transcriptional regulator [Nocardia]MCM6773088.1 MarR family transcriptional regulator [Nocardia pulmonis]MCM6785609.1 MarR family transcriptional regulator [Nocardia sp. CDC159]